ncbi:hypothetical protein DPEC_G00266750 [Dallia pectoralis]|uniref:Uncharacterized protein n=1 Tax=Dallia pectoralis TaxID=75939 RepID=A0ACC2FN66_DALPE|nr:hypothetical protein DPEC_G00266750 [Dallia pectoralis]
MCPASCQQRMKRYLNTICPVNHPYAPNPMDFNPPPFHPLASSLPGIHNILTQNAPCCNIHILICLSSLWPCCSAKMPRWCPLPQHKLAKGIGLTHAENGVRTSRGQGISLGKENFY